MMWTVYLVRCRDSSLYVGITNDLVRRLAAHNAGTASKYTRVRLPVELVFVENCADRSIASKREMEIKSLARAGKLALIQSGREKRQLAKKCMRGLRQSPLDTVCKAEVSKSG